MTLGQSVVQLIYAFLSIIAFILAALIAPLIIVIYILFCCWSKFVALAFVKNCQILNGEDVMAGIDQFPTNSIVNGLLIVKGMFTVEAMQKLFATRVLDLKDTKGNLLLPKYTQCLVEHWDYWFWTPAKNFDINDHIRYGTYNALKTDAELKEIVNATINRPISLSKPQWEIIVLPCLISEENSDLEPKEQTAIVLRAHHAIGDGVSFLRIIVSQLSDSTKVMITILEKAARNRNIKLPMDMKSKLAKILRSVYNFICIPAYVVRPFFIQERHALHGPKLTGVVVSNWANNIKLETIKCIKNKVGTTVNDVIMSCLASAVRQCFLRKKLTPPETVNIYIPVNLQGPFDVLNNINKLAYLMPTLPTGDMSNLARLWKTKTIMDEVKASPQIIANRLVFKYYGSVMPNKFIKKLHSLSPCAFILSNLPGPTNKVFLGKHEVESVIPLATTRSSTGVGVIVVSYGGKLSISTTIDLALLDNQSDAVFLLQDIEAEVKKLYTVSAAAKEVK